MNKYLEKTHLWIQDHFIHPVKKYTLETKQEVHWLIPGTADSPKQLEHQETDQKTQELLEALEQAGCFQQETLECLKKTRDAINTALQKNTYNIRTNFLDIVPLWGTSYLWLIVLLISFSWTLSDFHHRVTTLQPLLKKARKIQREEAGISLPENKKNRLIANLDIEVEALESAIEVASIVVRPFIPLVFVLPIIEILIDMRNRNNYYSHGRELHSILNDLSEVIEQRQDETKTVIPA